MQRYDLINRLLPTNGSYLEIGVAQADCFRRIRAAFKLGVDPVLSDAARDCDGALLEMASDAFFRAASGFSFNVIFIDGWHEHKQALRDVEGALGFLAPVGTIVLHDCNPPEEKHQTVPASDPAWYGDVWKSIVELRQRQDLDVFTIDTDCGLGVVRRGPPKRTLMPAELTWSNFVRHRREWLGLLSVQEFTESTIGWRR